jgi:7-cyano-7-deazaguanine synthase
MVSSDQRNVVELEKEMPEVQPVAEVKTAIAIVSGGLDSTTMVYDLLHQGYQVDCLSFDYGQRHGKELRYAERTADKLGLRHDTLYLVDSGITELISQSGSTLVSDTPVPEGHYAEDTMRQTVVPNRNMMMLSMACAVAIARRAKTVGFGVHSGDHFIYPDCRPEFVFTMGQAMLQGNAGFHNFVSGEFEKPFQIDGHEYYYTAHPITTPYLHSTKADIAFRALELGVPLSGTWSCYKGGDYHCGRCGTCVERLEAISEAYARLSKGLETRDVHGNDIPPVDPTRYEDAEYWKEAVKAHQQQDGAIWKGDNG